MFRLQRISHVSAVVMSMIAIVLLPSTTIASETSQSTSQGTPEPRQWHNEAPAEISQLIELLGTFVDQHPEVFAGVALSYDRQSINLYSSSRDLNISSPEVAMIIAEHPDSITVIPVQHSYSELQEIQNSYTASLTDQGLIYSAVDVVNNKVVLGVREGSTAETLLHSQSRDSSFQDPVSVIQADSPRDASGRYDDFSPFFMGGSIISNGGCSLGIPLVVDGKKGALTAGHCLGGLFVTPRSKTVGSILTTAYPGNADRYGDWKIITGEKYASNIFTGSARSSSTANLPISGESKRRVGQEVCHSGATTGQRCRYVVEYVDTNLVVDGIKSTHQTAMYHDSDRDGYSDCDGFDHGDSGGPVFSANPDKPGTVKVHGIVKGFYELPLGRCRYTYTQLSGVRAWRSNVRVDY